MIKNIKFLKYKGHEIMIHDYQNMQGEELAKTIPKVVIDSLSLEKNDALIIINVENTIANSAVTQAFKKAAVDIKPMTKKMAVVGVKGIQRIILNAINRFSNLGITAFDTMEDAIEWIVRED